MMKVFSLVMYWNKPVFFTIANRKYFYNPKEQTFYYGTMSVQPEDRVNKLLVNGSENHGNG